MRVRLAWLLFGLTVAAAVGQTVLLSTYRPLLSARAFNSGWPIITLSAIAGAFMGALVISRYPGHRVGWLLSVGQFGTAIGLFCDSIGGRMLTADIHSAAGHRAELGAVLFSATYSFALTAALFLLVPDGRLLSRRWRIPLCLSWLGLGLQLAAVLATDPADVQRDGETSHVGALANVLFASAIISILLALVAGAVALVLRLRRATGVTRLQLRWIATSATALAGYLLALLIASVFLPTPQTTSSVAVSVPLFLIWASLPVSTGVAILRYRLYDIDIIINRAVLLTVATAVVGVGYVGLVVGVTRAAGIKSPGSLPSLLGIVLVALAFQPLRRRVVGLADRLAYGARAAPYDALSDFSRRLGQSPAPSELLPSVAQAAGMAVAARSVLVRLEVPGAAGLSATWSGASTDHHAADHHATDHHATDHHADVAVAVTDPSGRLGSIEVTMPPGRSPRSDDLRLLHDIAEQAALGFRNARLEAELAAHVQALDQRTDELDSSRRRLIEAGDAQRRRLVTVLSREVLPSLQELPAALDDVRGTGSATFAVGRLDRLVSEVTDALEALRELTRGVFPTLLIRSGLGPALSSYASRIGRAAALLVDSGAAGPRFSARAEAAAYFCVTEALRVGAGDLTVRVGVEGSDLVVEIRGQRIDGMDREAMADRVEALGGSMIPAAATVPSATPMWVRIPVDDGRPIGAPLAVAPVLQDST